MKQGGFRLGSFDNAKKAYEKALEYNPNNQDAKYDRSLPHGLRARFNNQGASGVAVKYEGGGSLCPIIISETSSVHGHRNY